MVGRKIEMRHDQTTLAPTTGAEPGFRSGGALAHRTTVPVAIKTGPRSRSSRCASRGVAGRNGRYVQGRAANRHRILELGSRLTLELERGADPARSLTANGPGDRESAPESETGDLRRPFCSSERLKADADRAENVLDDAAEEQERDDRDDGDEGEDQSVFRETLSALSGKHC